MVKLWPFGGDQTSAASFEKTLSSLTIKIQNQTTSISALRQRSRKLKVSWTIYGGFTYILTSLIFLLVTGWQNWGTLEYGIVLGGPVVLWGVRKGVGAWYEYWIGKGEGRLGEWERERGETIERLKKATRYDSTAELIEKYGGGGGKPGKTPEGGKGGGKRLSQGVQRGMSGQPGQQQQRVFPQPPPTANIPRGPGPPQQQLQHQLSPPQPQTPQAPPSPTAEFAPNAFSPTDPHPPTFNPATAASTIAPAAFGPPTWYDRILDALLGEDETSSKNRFALICSSCRLVNGQAPPGARTLEDVGKWRCGGCGAINGVESEKEKVGRLVREVAKKGNDEDIREKVSPVDESAEDMKIASASDGEGYEVEIEEESATSPAASTRSKKKNGARKG